MKKTKKIIIAAIAGIIALAAILAGIIVLDNIRVKSTEQSINSAKIPPEIDGCKIALITDFHNSDNYSKVIRAVKKGGVQLIAVVGDSINMDEDSYENTTALIQELTKIAPVYMVSGNHERWSEHEEKFFADMEALGAVNLNGEVAEISFNGAKFNLAGFHDTLYSDDAMRGDVLVQGLSQLYQKIPDKSLYTVLLFHRANLLDYAVKKPFDLILSGHLHGGQINLPKIREKILMERVYSDKYCKGYYSFGTQKAVVSAGLEKNWDNIRVFNPSEVVFITLRTIK